MRKKSQRLRQALTLGVTLTAVLLLATPAHSRGPDGEGQAAELPDGSGQLSARVIGSDGQPGGAGQGGTGGGTTSSRGTVQYYWRGPLPPAAMAGMSCPDDLMYQLIRHDLETGDTSTVGRECFLPEATPPTPTPPPAPPTLAEMAALAEELVVTPEVHISPDPDYHGITGMDTRLWYEGQDRVEATAEIRGYTVTAWAEPARYEWDTDDARPNRVVAAVRPGSREDPAAIWVYETKGHYTITHRVHWSGGWTFHYHDPLLEQPDILASGELPTIVVTSTLPYQVDEIRSQLTHAD
jgi:hypothetical protein